ncbi:Fun14 Domain-Containing Protein 2 [Manis pentadactyla]|nr:Fun14 Domain-Containing Protein 2 [Manis pentadactyla]
MPIGSFWLKLMGQDSGASSIQVSVAPNLLNTVLHPASSSSRVEFKGSSVLHVPCPSQDAVRTGPGSRLLTQTFSPAYSPAHHRSQNLLPPNSLRKVA